MSSIAQSFDENLRDLWDLHKSRKHWLSDEVFISVQTSWDDPTPVEVNLMDTLEQVQAVKRATDYDDHYWLPAMFNQNSREFRERIVIPYFVRPCLSGGFNLMSKGWEGSHSCIRFVCNRGKHYRRKPPEAGKVPTDRISRTCRPIRGETETCKFSFKVWWDGDLNRWYFPKAQAGCKHHTGHTHREPHECRLLAKDYGEDVIQTIIDALQSSIRPAQIQALISTQTGHGMDRKQIAHLKKQIRESTEINMAVIESIAGNGPIVGEYQPTPADRLLSELETSPKYSYTLLYAQYDTDELKVYRRDKRDGESQRSAAQ